MKLEDLSDFLDSDVESEMKALVLALRPRGVSQRWVICDFATMMRKVHGLGLFKDLIVFWTDANQRILFTSDGRPTPAGLSFFGKLFKRFNRETFTDSGESFRFVRMGSRTSPPRFVIVRLPRRSSDPAAAPGPVSAQQTPPTQPDPV